MTPSDTGAVLDPGHPSAFVGGKMNERERAEIERIAEDLSGGARPKRTSPRQNGYPEPSAGFGPENTSRGTVRCSRAHLHSMFRADSDPWPPRNSHTALSDRLDDFEP
jgi:hypothetical protein